MTRNKRDIDALFKESSHKLSEPPSSNAWRKLERKLDGRRGRYRVSMYRYMAMAAALVALVAMISVFSSSLKSTQPTNVELEDLVIIDRQEDNRRQVSEYIQKISSRGAQPVINEGSKEQVLISNKGKRRDG